MNGNSRDGHRRSRTTSAIEHLFADLGEIAPLDHLLGIYTAVSA